MTNNLDVGLNIVEQILSWDNFFVRVKLRLCPCCSPDEGAVNTTRVRFSVGTAGVCRTG